MTSLHRRGRGAGGGGGGGGDGGLLMTVARLFRLTCPPRSVALLAQVELLVRWRWALGFQCFHTP